MAKNNFGSSFEKLNQSTGGVAGQVASGVKSVGRAATVDVAKGVAKAPVDILRDILGGDKASEKGTEDLAGQAGDDSQNPAKSQSDFSKKLEDDRRMRDAKLRQARMVVAQMNEQWEKTKQENEKKESMEEQKEDQKKNQIKQLGKQKKEQNFAVQMAKQKGGSREMGKKKH